MGRVYQIYLDNDDKATIFCCSSCQTHLTRQKSIISKAFQGHYGRAWLFDTVWNIIEGPTEDRSMTTGIHTVKDIFCANCDKLIGWKYEKAFEDSQKYKEGKFILERVMIREISPQASDIDSRTLQM